MKITSEARDDEGGDAVELLLENAAPRPAPPTEVENEIRETLRQEWVALTRVRRTRQRIAGFAVAASAILAVAVTLSTLRGTGVAPAEVATIARTHGSIVLEGERSGQLPAEAFTSVTTRQLLLTADNSAAALRWGNGGSLRIDENTRIEFTSASEVYLHSGRLYYDSGGAASDQQLVIQTKHGSVMHVGTQFMAEVGQSSLTVSVREGIVEVEGASHDQTAFEGQIVELVGAAPARVMNTKGIGSQWEWIELVTPAIDMDGRSTYEFLNWVGRETGHDVVFSTDAAEELARGTLFVGDIKGHPRNDLRLWMMTTDLEAHFDAEGPTLTVSVSR